MAPVVSQLYEVNDLWLPWRSTYAPVSSSQYTVSNSDERRGFRETTDFIYRRSALVLLEAMDDSDTWIILCKGERI
jgi:hypothetical protein